MGRSSHDRQQLHDRLGTNQVLARQARTVHQPIGRWIQTQISQDGCEPIHGAIGIQPAQQGLRPQVIAGLVHLANHRRQIGGCQFRRGLSQGPGRIPQIHDRDNGRIPKPIVGRGRQGGHFQGRSLPIHGRRWWRGHQRARSHLAKKLLRQAIGNQPSELLARSGMGHFRLGRCAHGQPPSEQNQSRLSIALQLPGGFRVGRQSLKSPRLKPIQQPFHWLLGLHFQTRRTVQKLRAKGQGNGVAIDHGPVHHGSITIGQIIPFPTGRSF